MTMQWMRERGDADIAAYVGLGMGATDYGQFMQQPFPLDSMRVPVLDLYGEKEFPAVLKMAPARLAMMQKAGNPQSQQIVMPNADHYFHGQGEKLTQWVAKWLGKLNF